MSKYFELLRQSHKNEAMAEFQRTPYAPTGFVVQAPRPSQLAEERSDWINAIRILKKHWRLSVSCAIAVFASVAIVTLMIQPEYAPTARMEIDPPGAELFSLDRASGSGETEYLQTQAQNLRSDTLAIQVIRELSLGENSDVVPPGAMKRLDEQKGAVNPGAVDRREAVALAAFRSRLTVRRETDSRLVDISFSSHDPVLAATVTNTIAKAFIERTFQTQHAAILQSTEWLSKQLDDIREKMDESNKRLAEFQRVSGISETAADRSTFSDQVAELNRQLTAAQGERIQLDAYFNDLQRKDAGRLPQVRNNPVYQQLTQKLAEIRSQIAEALAIYGSNHPNVRKLQNTANELEAQLDIQQNAIYNELKTTHAAAIARERLLKSRIRGAAEGVSLESKYNQLKREAQANTELYNGLYAKIKEAGISAASKSSNIRVVDEARVLRTPTRPNRILNFALGLFGGLFCGVVASFLRERFDTRIHSLHDLRGWTGLPVVSMLPALSSAKQLGNRRVFRLLPPAHPSRSIPQMFVLNDPYSPEAEALRGLETSILLSTPDRPPQMLLVTSAFPGEGKTTIAVNLAISLASRGKTCIVDADLRRPGAARTFGISNQIGLSDVLLFGTPLDRTLVQLPGVNGLMLLPPGTTPPDALQLILSEKSRILLEDLRSRFDFILIDSPPVIPYSDGRALAALMDGVIFVARSGITTREALVRSMQLLESVHSAPLLAMVLNEAHSESSRYKYYGYSEEYMDSSESAIGK